MNAPTTATTKLSYKELQAALKELREQGKTSIKLNSKQEVLEQEYERINNTSANDEPAVKDQCDTSNGNSNYPFCSNTVKVENKPVKRSDELFAVKVIPAMNSKYAPSWLCKNYTVYIIDGVEYLPHELEAQLQGQVCQLPAVVNEMKLAANLPPRLQQPALKDRVSKARPVTAPIINTAKDLPKVKVTYKAQEDYSPYFIDTTKAARYSKTLGDVEKQAARNLEDAVRATKQGFRNVISFAKGFHKAQVERARKAA